MAQGLRWWFSKCRDNTSDVPAHINWRNQVRPLGKFLAPAVLVLMLGTSPAWAGNPATISVTVTIQNLSVSASGPIAFGTVLAASSTVSGSASTVTNDGNVTETFSLQLTNPVTWSAVQAAPAAEQYALLAMFNAAAEPVMIQLNRVRRARPMPIETTMKPAFAAFENASSATTRCAVKKRGVVRA